MSYPCYARVPPDIMILLFVAFISLVVSSILAHSYITQAHADDALSPLLLSIFHFLTFVLLPRPRFHRTFLITHFESSLSDTIVSFDLVQLLRKSS